MDWVEFVMQNRSMLDLKFMVSKPKHPRHEWKGDYTRHIHLWLKFNRERLYIPISLIADAGYIDLWGRSYTVISSLEGAEEMMKEAYAYFSEHAG